MRGMEARVSERSSAINHYLFLGTEEPPASGMVLNTFNESRVAAENARWLNG